jgi:hypothetical protein
MKRGVGGDYYWEGHGAIYNYWGYCFLLRMWHLAICEAEAYLSVSGVWVNEREAGSWCFDLLARPPSTTLVMPDAPTGREACI